MVLVTKSDTACSTVQRITILQWRNFKYASSTCSATSQGLSNLTNVDYVVSVIASTSLRNNLFMVRISWRLNHKATMYMARRQRRRNFCVGGRLDCLGRSTTLFDSSSARHKDKRYSGESKWSCSIGNIP